MKTKENIIQKAILFFLILISILLVILILQRSGIILSSQSISKRLLNNGELVLSEDGEVAQTVNASNWDTSKVTATKDAEGKEVPVPKGYVGSSVTGENKISEGYVIYEGTVAVNSSNVASARTSRNQWVWIPVENPERIYEEINGVKKAKLYTYSNSGRSLYENSKLEPNIIEYDTTTNLTNGGLTGMTPDKLYQELQQEFDSTIESIKKYGGFYIGRYETGNLSQNIPVVRKMNTDLGNQTWYTIYKKIGYLAANSNVKSNIIWGCLWDETIECMEERGKINYSNLMALSHECGNYVNSTFTYTTINGTSATKPANASVIIPTGSTEYSNKYNIYDIIGNVWEWTLEGTTSTARMVRGGASGSYDVAGHPASTRGNFWNPSFKAAALGYRAYLYIK